MNRKLFLLFVLAGFGAFVVFNKSQNVSLNSGVKDFKDATYEIDSKTISLKNGINEVEFVPGSASKLSTQYFGNEAYGDFNSDGINDVVFLVTQNNGGSGTFYYVVLALGSKNGYVGSNSIFLGDRIAPQTTEFRNSEIIVNYADRLAGEAMTARPSVGVSKYLKVENNKLVSIEN